MNLSKKEKVKYICELNTNIGYKRYLRKEYIKELDMWGRERVISEQTFNKRLKEGFNIEYRHFTVSKEVIQETLDDINDLIDLALFLKDEVWFTELVKQKEVVETYLKSN